jgi:hypothetical protein
MNVAPSVRGDGEMGREQGQCPLGIASKGCFENILMLLGDVALLPGEGDGEAGITFALGIEQTVQAHEPRTAAALDQGKMEGGMGVGPSVVGSRRVRHDPFGRARQPMGSGY